MNLNDLAPHLPQRAADTAAAAIGRGADLRVEASPDGARLRVYLTGAPGDLTSRLVGAGWEVCVQPGRFRLFVTRRVGRPAAKTHTQPVPPAREAA